MLNSKLDLFQQSWIDTVFEGRNKAYGAYDLRVRESGLTVRATIIGAVIFCVLISAPLIMKKIGINEGRQKALTETITVVNLEELPEDVAVEVPQAPPPTEVQSIKDIKKFTNLVAASAEEADAELVTQEELKTADAGARNIDASEDGMIVIEEKPAEVAKAGQVIEQTNTIYTVQNVQVKPSYPGGEQKFVEYIMLNLKGIELEEITQLNMRFSFVIERDGSLTDIRIMNDGGYPAIAARAVQVLSKSPKWSPGVINGRPVRVNYEIPIKVVTQ